MRNIKKFLYVIVGIVSLTLGSIGAILPILPTTPFLLLAAFCFVRGSSRFDKWFKQTKLYKAYLEDFEKSRGMTMKQKVHILLFADFMLLFPLVILDSLVMKGFIILLATVKYYYFMYRIKTIEEK